MEEKEERNKESKRFQQPQNPQIEANNKLLTRRIEKSLSQKLLKRSQVSSQILFQSNPKILLKGSSLKKLCKRLLKRIYRKSQLKYLSNKIKMTQLTTMKTKNQYCNNKRQIPLPTSQLCSKRKRRSQTTPLLKMILKMSKSQLQRLSIKIYKRQLPSVKRHINL